MALKNQLQQDLIAAMKEKDELKTSALRMLKAAIIKFEVSGTEKKEATDEDIIQLLGKEVKQRKDSVEQFKAGGREAMAEQEEKEMAILQAYLPKQLTEAELTEIIQRTQDETGAVTKADIGKLMGHLMPKIKGKADGAMVNKIVSGLLH
jgi:hypothetical protein